MRLGHCRLRMRVACRFAAKPVKSEASDPGPP
jgi:hypothetical protein